MKTESGYKFYGRRKGKSLRIARQAALDNNLPQISIAVDDKPIDLRNLFSGSKEQHWLEIGFGNGEVIAAYAARHPDIGFIGAEPFINGQSYLLQAIEQHSIQNIRIFPDDARLLLHRLPDQSFDKIFLLFSDPWPKTSHKKRRFLQPETLDHFARLLKPGGEFRFATDDPGLCDHMFGLTYHHPVFQWTARQQADWQTRPDSQALSKYEEKRKSGFDPVYLSFMKVKD